MSDEEYPECAKMLLVKDESQLIGGFIEWLNEQGFGIADAEASEEHGFPIYTRLSIEAMLAKYFEIDMDLVEKERQVMLDNFREKQDAK